ncbi:VWA domain-containing protein [Vibrio metoecus]|uniref:VWA domain-containing protein n=1 Tax=Vibrio metoecus TaxID=1481663 RepID=UPI0012AD6F80|nr:VWA domain-containing protein [Vibrio metoecus]
MPLTFLYPYWLWLLIPSLGFAFWLKARKNQRGLIAPHLAHVMGVGAPQSRHLSGLLGVGWMIAVLALAGPSWQSAERPSVQNSAARVLIMDMSQSMYATDLAPNRLTQARYKALDLLKGWHEGSTGLVAYAADAYVVSPLTRDSATLGNLIPLLSPEIMPYQGANAANAVDLAISMLQQAGHQKGDLILLTDDIRAAERQKITQQLENSSWRLIVLAIGTSNGAPITLSDGSLLKSPQGETVIAKTSFEQMQQFTHSVQGVFAAYRADGADIEQILHITQQQTDVANQTSRKVVTEQVNNGYWLVLPLVIAALAIFRRGVIFTLLLIVGAHFPAQEASASPWLNQDQQAMRAFEAKQYSQAAETFRDPKWQGAARYYAKDYPGAIEAYSRIENPDLETQYNLANAYAQAGNFPKARELYEQVLKQQPNHQDAQHNLQVVNSAEQQQQDSASESKGQAQKEKSSGNSSDADDSEKTDSQTEQQPDLAQNQNQQHSAQPKADKEKSTEQAKPNNPEPTNEKNNDQNTLAQTKPLTSATDPNLDPLLRKLEQVENARDPSALLRAQLFLQAQRKPQPMETDQPW